MPGNEDAYIGATLNFDARVRGRRNELNLTQSDLAILVGVSKTTIQSYESGNIPKGLNLFRLSRALKCSIDYLLIGEESPYIQKEWIAEDPFGMNQEELLKYHKEIKNTWLEKGDTGSYKEVAETLRHQAAESPAPDYDPHGGWQPSNLGLGKEELQLIGQVYEILRSDTIFRTALISNIRAFHAARAANDELSQTRTEIETIRKENKDLKASVSAIEQRLADLEDKPQCPGPAEDTQELKKSEAM